MPSLPATIMVFPRRATTRSVSASTSRRRNSSRSSGSVGAATSLPSTFENTFDVITTTSPSASHGAAATSAVATSSPGRNSGSPGTGSTSMPPAAE
jgi:hypothetical protein